MNPTPVKQLIATGMVSGLIAILGCTPPPGAGSDSPVDRYIKSGQTQAKRNDFVGALAAYNKALSLDLDNAVVHYELAGLFDNELNSPEKALYHYLRVLEINPEYRWADIIKDRMPGLRMRVSSGTIPMVPYPELEEQIVRLHQTLAQKNAELQQQANQNEELRRRLRVTLSSQGTPSQPTPQRTVVTTPATQSTSHPPAPVEDVSRPITSSRTASPVADNTTSQSRLRYTPPEQIRHTIVKGDTLYSLSRRHGIAVADIVRANPGLVAEDIKIGRTIIIPVAR